MHCSFNLNKNEESLQLIYNEQKIYIKKDCQKISEVELNNKESFVFKFLVANSSVATPQSARDIEKSFKRHFNEELSLYALKNIIASIRKKYRQLCQDAQVISHSQLISNLYKVGYFLDLEKASISANCCKKDINHFKPARLEVFKLLLRTYRKEAAQSLLVMLGLSAGMLFVVYFFQILYTTTIAVEYSQNTQEIADEVMSYGCDNDGAIHALRHSLNIDSVLLTTASASCFISRNESKLIDPSRDEDFYDSRDFSYTRFSAQESEVQLVARISKRSIESRYRNSVLPLFIDTVKIEKNGFDIVTLGEAGIPVYRKVLPSGATLHFYSQHILTLWVALFVTLTLICYRHYLLGAAMYLYRWTHISYEEEPIINTQDNSILYYELLSRVCNVGVLNFIHAMRKSNLLTFHTILQIEAVKKAKQNNSHAIYGINVCPSALVGRNFRKIREHLEAMEVNEFIVEITEYSNLGYGNEVIDNINEIKRLGITIALDDFGTGNNNIEIISVISPTYLKLDRCFVKDIESGEHHTAVLTSISEIGRLSNMTMIYEGVETRRQQYILSQLGYSLHQGYLYSRP
ncbi:EAL domain-containing protein [Vibrio profundi]|uniref:EAL domain-containing protein n=1 Tax=Vibrio profundi TaxID=1774960 RepID=UPI003734CAFD